VGDVIHANFPMNGPLPDIQTEQELTYDELIQALDAIYEVFNYFCFTDDVSLIRPAVVELHSLSLRDLIEELRASLFQGDLYRKPVECLVLANTIFQRLRKYLKGFRGEDIRDLMDMVRIVRYDFKAVLKP
jgi:hypothetical protein